MIERLPRGQFPVNAVIGREGKRELLPMRWDHFPLFVHLMNGTATRRQFIPRAARLGSFVRHKEGRMQLTTLLLLPPPRPERTFLRD
jgi:hypothetical protein